MKERGVYKMKTVSRLTGFTPAVLRAWETRHKFLVPARMPSGHRLYTETDLRVLERVRERLEQGHSIGEIAVLGRERILAEAELAERLHSRPRKESPAAIASEARSALSLGLLEELRRAIVAAAQALDTRALDSALDRAFGSVSHAQVLPLVIRPAAEEIGELWAAGKVSVAAEHLASAAFVARLHELLAAHATTEPTAPLALVACLPDEQHEVGALAVAVHLAQGGHRVLYLGQSLPFEDLERACDLAAPAVVALSATREALLALHAPRLVELVRRRRVKTEFWLGGLGVGGDVRALVEAGVRVLPPGSEVGELALPGQGGEGARGRRRAPRA